MPADGIIQARTLITCAAAAGLDVNTRAKIASVQTQVKALVDQFVRMGYPEIYGRETRPKEQRRHSFRAGDDGPRGRNNHSQIGGP